MGNPGAGRESITRLHPDTDEEVVMYQRQGDRARRPAGGIRPAANPPARVQEQRSIQERHEDAVSAGLSRIVAATRRLEAFAETLTAAR